MDDNSLNYDLAKKVGMYFRLNEKQMDTIIKQVLSAVGSWKNLAIKIGIPNKEIELMKKAFNL